MNEHVPAHASTVYIGIEPNPHDRRRIPAIVRNWQPWNVEFPLADGPDAAKDELLAQVRALGLVPPCLYGLGFAHNDCAGACVRAGQRQWKHRLATIARPLRPGEAEE
ncbi:hypothetical protein ACIQ9Q_25050 [Streptomyces sp. NPDC094438]|uniref:hypothetical protein n=1 Tax=Streptomyces sp. NPDC094438 TaxID=3366061 RepID=UPI003800F514